VRKITKGNSSFRRGISTTITAVIIVILVLAVGAGVYFYTASNVTASTSTKTSISTSVSTSVSTVTKTPTQSPVTITVWEQYAPSSNANSEFGAFNKSLTAFKTAYPWITVNVQTHPDSSIRSDFITASLANQAPDIMRGPNDQTGALVSGGFVTPIDQFANTTFLSQYFPAAVQDFQFQGHTWGLAENTNFLALIYNKALVPTPPATTDQLITMAQSITKTDATGKITTAGIAFNYAGGLGGGYWWWPFLSGFGGSVFQTGNPKMPTVNSSQAVASIEFLNSLIAQYKVMPAASDYGTAESLFKSGHAGMTINGPWDIPTYQQNKTLNFGVAPLPTVPSTGKPLAPFVGAQGWWIASGKSSAVTLASFQFIAWMTNFNSQKNMASVTADLPSNQALAKDPLIANDPIRAGFLAQAATGAGAVNTPEMSVVYSNIGGYLTSATATSSSSSITTAEIQAQLNTAEATIIRAIGSA
jgi:arabinogalactan oligomer/maltooligosaccharide transport system substrate-binding protein